MSIIHRYILSISIRNLLLTILVFCLLFIVLDFFERIDNMIGAQASFGSVLQYFLFKIPLTLSLMLPVATLVSTILTFGILSKNSEITAMRASGMQLLWIAKPHFALALALSFFALILNESLVPYCTRRVKEIYNIDIKQKDKRGGFSQEDFWWRSGSSLYSVDIFDSRSNTFHQFSRLDLSPDFKVQTRIDAANVHWIDPLLGWNMQDVNENQVQYSDNGASLNVQTRKFSSLPLPIKETPTEFYETKTDPQTMSFQELRHFIKQQKRNGIKISGYKADLQAKLAFPFAVLIVAFAALPFSLRSARSGSMAAGLIACFVIGFSYYAVHSMSLALGRAELWPAVMSAWMANILIGIVGLVLNLGAEAP